MPPSLRFVVPPDQGGSALGAFLGASGRLTRKEARLILRRGGVFVNRRRTKGERHTLQGGDRVEVHLPMDPLPAHIDELTAQILYRDNMLIVVNKPAGMPVGATRQSDRGNVLTSLQQLIGRQKGDESRRLKPRPVHRLDREVSGVVAVALEKKAAADLSVQLREHKAGRRYLAVVKGEPEAKGRLIHGLIKGPRGTSYARALSEDEPTKGDPGQIAITQYERLDTRGAYALLAVTLETGRTHQIRAQLAAVGLPIVGDLRYGDRSAPSPSFKRVALHAWQLELTHPGTGRAERWEAPLPPELESLLDSLGLRLNTQPMT